MLFESLAYSRDAVSAGEIWRLPASAIAHLSVSHLAGNVLAAALLILVLRPLMAARQALGVLAIGALGTGLGLHFATSLAWYAGLSGALYALAAHGALMLAAQRRWRWHGRGSFALVALQVTIDQSRSLSWLGEALAPQSHLWGFVTGAVVWALVSTAVAAAAWLQAPRADAREELPHQVTILP